MFYRPWVVIVGLSALLFLVNYVFVPEPALAPAFSPAEAAPSPAVRLRALSADELPPRFSACLRQVAALDPDDLPPGPFAGLYALGGHEAVVAERCAPLLGFPVSVPFVRAYGGPPLTVFRALLEGAAVAVERPADAGLPPDLTPVELWALVLEDIALLVDDYHARLVAVHRDFLARSGLSGLALPAPPAADR